LARLAFETLGASFHLPLARRQLRGARVDLLRVPAQTLISRGELPLPRVELPSPGLDGSEQRVQLPLGFRHGPLGDLQHVTRDPETPRDGEPVGPPRHAFERSEEHTSELQSPDHLVCRLLLEKKKKNRQDQNEQRTRRKHNHKPLYTPSDTTQLS